MKTPVLTINPQTRLLFFKDTEIKSAWDCTSKEEGFSDEEVAKFPLTARLAHYAKAVFETGCFIPLCALIDGFILPILFVATYLKTSYLCYKLQEFKAFHPNQDSSAKELAVIAMQIRILTLKNHLRLTSKYILPFIGDLWAKRNYPSDKDIYGNLPKRYNDLVEHLMPDPSNRGYYECSLRHSVGRIFSLFLLHPDTPNRGTHQGPCDCQGKL